MSTYFVHTDSIFHAIEVMAANTPFRAVRLLNKDDKWKYEFHLDSMRKELNLKADDPYDDVVARDYVYSKLDEEDLPGPVKTVNKIIQDAKDWLHTHNKVMANLTKDNTNAYKVDYLLKFAEKYYPAIELYDGLDKKDIVNAILTGISPEKPKPKQKAKPKNEPKKPKETKTSNKKKLSSAI